MRDTDGDFFLSEGALKPNDAAVALLVLEDSRYLMQLRDQRPGIFFPGHWGLFGGAIDAGEDAETALRRELLEELGYRPETVSYFTRFSFDFTPLGGAPVDRHYYEVQVTEAQAQKMVLGEGSAMRALSGPELLAQKRVTPYDAFAIWMHLTRPVHLRG